MRWRNHVEGTEDQALDKAIYQPPPGDPDSDHLAGKSLREVITFLAGKVAATSAERQGEVKTDAVYENGFDPLEGGFADPNSRAQPFAMIDRWIEILPAPGQVAAIEVQYKLPGND